MPTPRDPVTLVAAARLYYLDGRSQAEVADRLGTSRSNVSRMLTEAQRLGIVEIRVHDPSGRVTDLEDELTERFGLRDVRVVHAAPAAGVRVDDRVGVQAARLLMDDLKDSATVALSWGRALQSMVYAVTADQAHQGVTLVQLVGGLSSLSNEISGQELVRELAVRLGAQYRILHSPAVLESAASRDALLAEPAIEDALAEARQADVAFVGIGSPGHGSSAAVVSALRLSPEEEEAFWAAGPVGDIAARYYDAAGRPVATPADGRVVGVSLADLVAVPTVVGVAHGRAKAPGVLGALRGRLVDSLVCDETLARSVLSADRADRAERAAPTTPVPSPEA